MTVPRTTVENHNCTVRLLGHRRQDLMIVAQETHARETTLLAKRYKVLYGT